MTYDESSALMNDPSFRGRVKVSCLSFANTIMAEPANTPAHNTRMKWAANCMSQPDTVSIQITPTVVMDAAVQTAGADITDPALQTAVESTIEKML